MARDPFRLLVLKSLTEVIERVNPENDCEFDLRGRVFRGRLQYGDDDPIPMVSILEPPIPLEGLSGQPDNARGSSQWELLVQGFVSDDQKNPSDPAYRLMAEVKQALVREKKTGSLFGYHYQDAGRNKGNAVTNMQIGQGAVRPADETSGKGFFWLSLLISITENLGDPYL